MKGYIGKTPAVDLSRFTRQEGAIPDVVKEGLSRSKFMRGFPAYPPVRVDGDPVNQSHILKDGDALAVVSRSAGEERRQRSPRRLTTL